MSTPVCRVCLAVNVKMFYNQSYQLRELYETLTSVKLNMTGRPQGVCYICHSLLQRCYELAKMARRSEQILSDMLDNVNEVNQQTISTLDRKVKDSKVINLSVATVKHTAAGAATFESCPVIETNDDDEPIEVKLENISSDNEHTTEERLTLGNKDASNNVLSRQSSIKGNLDTKQILSDTNETVETSEQKLNPVMDPKASQNKGETDKCHAKNTQKCRSDPTLYTCEQCNKSFSFKSSLINHKRTHAKGKPYTCDHCNKTFEERNILVKHLLTHPKGKRYTCDLCKKSFTQIHRLVVHKRIHTGERPYSCKQCGKCFSENSNLVKHMRTHTGDKPFTCKHCKKKFTHRDGLVKHERIHTGEKPYACMLCDKSFAEKSNLVKHIQTHTEVKPFMCELCVKRFAHKSSLVKHKRTHTEYKPKIRLIFPVYDKKASMALAK